MKKTLFTTAAAVALTAALSISALAAPYVPITEDMHDDYGVCTLGENVEVDIVNHMHKDTYAYCYSNDLAVRVNGYLTNFPDAQPFIDENSRTLIPLRFVTEALGADVSWDQATKTATVEQDGIRCDITIGKADMLVTENGSTSTVTMDTQAVLKDSRTFVPIRYVAESLGAWVGWSNAYKTVEIVKGQLTPEEDELLYSTKIPDNEAVIEYKYGYNDAKNNRYLEMDDFTYGIEPWKVISLSAGGTPENAVEYFHRNLSGAGYNYCMNSNGRVRYKPYASSLTGVSYDCLKEETGKLTELIISEAKETVKGKSNADLAFDFRTDAANILAYDTSIVYADDGVGMCYIRGMIEMTPKTQKGVDYIRENFTAVRSDVQIGKKCTTAVGLSAIIGLKPIVYADKLFAVSSTAIKAVSLPS